jgi:hypothetical protein
MWLTYLRVSARAADLDFDLAASVTPGTAPTAQDAGIELMDAVPIADSTAGLALWPLVAGGGAAFAVVAVGNQLAGGAGGPGGPGRPARPGSRDPQAFA